MRARPLTLLTALAAVTLVVVAGCEARVEAEAYSGGRPHFVSTASATSAAAGGATAARHHAA